MFRLKTIGIAAIIAVAVDLVCTGIFLSGGFPFGSLLWYPAYALLYPAFRVHELIPERYLSIDEAFAMDLLLPLIEFFIVALFALEVRRRRKVINNKEKSGGAQ